MLLLQDDQPTDAASQGGVDAGGADAALGGDPSQGADADGEMTADLQGLWDGLTDGTVSGDDLVLAWQVVGWPILKAIVLIVVVLFIAGWVARIISGAARKARVEETLSRFFGQMARWAMLMLGALAILNTFGVETTSFAAVIAAAGFAVGMALSGTLGNFAAGIMLLVFRPFKVGDFVEVAGAMGTVHQVDLFLTTLNTPDNKRYFIPNGKIFGDVIQNITYNPKRRVDVAVGVDYPANIDETRAVLERAVTSVEGILDDPEPQIVLGDLGDSAVGWTVRAWANTPDYLAMKQAVTRAVKMHLDEAGIGIPFPQQDVNVTGPVEVTVRSG